MTGAPRVQIHKDWRGRLRLTIDGQWVATFWHAGVLERICCGLLSCHVEDALRDAVKAGRLRFIKDGDGGSYV